MRYTVLATALGLSLAAGQAAAQSNASGIIYGSAPSAAPGSVVHIQSVDTGFSRDITVDSSGRYRAASLPVGRYSVSLRQNGATVDSRDNVLVTISQSTEVSFAAAAAASAAEAKNLGGVQVTGNTLPSIDTTAVDTRTTLTSQQLAKLPLARDTTSVALLAPGAVAADSRYGNAASFGGSSASENQYYINGFSVTNALSGVGSVQLPYDAIDQEQVLTGGYGAEFGRSTGGVINVVSKRGTNEWKGDVQVFYTPSGLMQSPSNIYRRNGQLYWDRHKDTYSETQYSASFGGPLIKDKLFFFAAADWINQNGRESQGLLDGSYSDNYASRVSRWLTKIDWNINDSNILEFTGIGDREVQNRALYGFDYGTDSRTGYTGHELTRNYNGVGTNATPGGNVYIAHYTGYITDDLTINALYGKSKSDHVQQLDSTAGVACPYVNDNRQGIANPVTGCWVGGVSAPLVPGAQDKTSGWRIDIEYHLGDHDLRAGVDNYNLRSFSGSVYQGGNRYDYLDVGDGSAIVDRTGSFDPGQFPNGYFVDHRVFDVGARVRTQQQAQYIEDNWQVTDRWHAYLGLRNEQFSNYNGVGKEYVRQRHQLAPRLGVSWDVYGDSTFKVYANAGRYHLALPSNVAIRGASPSTYTSQYGTATGIDPVTGAPINFNPLPNGQIYLNGENGRPLDPKTVAAKDLKSYYQDEFILGFDKQLGTDWTYGARATYRKLRGLIDDMCDSRPFIKWGEEHGVDIANSPAFTGGSGCFLFNPGRGNTFLVDTTGQGNYQTVRLSAKDLGYPDLKRAYYALNLYLAHQFSDKWFGRIDYTFSRSYGNSEGQLNSDIGQQDVSVTQAWDFPELMEGSNGPLPNDRKHQIKAYGYYQPNEEWLISGVARIYSGAPISCFGTRPAGDPFGYTNAYFYCNGELSPRGTSGRTPWIYQLDASVQYRPNWAGRQLAFSLDAFNLLGKQRAQNVYEYGETGSGAPDQDFKRAISTQSPRYFRFGVRYDFTL